MEAITDPELIHFEPPERPLTGLPAFRAFLRNYTEIFPRSIYERDLVRFRQGFQDTLVVCDPKLIRELLVDRAGQFHRDPLSRRALTAFVGESSLILAEGVHWQWQRRAVAPTFRHETLLSFVPIFSRIAETQVTQWCAAARDRPIDVGAAMNQATFEIIVETMLGGSNALAADDYRRALTTMMHATRWHCLLALLALPRWTPFPNRGRSIRALAQLQHRMERIIADRRANPAARVDLIDLLMAGRDAETGRGMTDDELAANLLAFINAGHETTASALTWTLWLVARDSSLQDRLADEIAAVVGQETVAAKHIEQLRLCRQALQESMRLYPPASSLARQATGDTHLGDERVSRSTMILVPIFALHRHVKLWQNPNSFDLERFAPAAVKSRSRFAYLPFGAGPRTCVGASFAMTEATVILATLLQSFRLRTLAGYKPKPVASLSLRPEGGVPLLIERRR
jgi:cytochrome P450